MRLRYGRNKGLGTTMRLAAVCLALLLAGCSTVGVDLDTPAKPRTLDYVNDDMGALLIAFDVPRGIGPVDGASTLSFDVALPGNSARHVKAMLAPSDADDVDSRLPPPGQGRTYYLFGLSDKDQAAIREAQATARAAHAPASAVTLTLAPRLCASGPIDPKAVTISVLASLSGNAAPTPLIDHQLLANLLAQSGGTLPPCG